MEKLKKKICVVTGYRSDYTKLKSVLTEIKNHPELDLQLVAGAAHLLEDYGKTINFIKQDGFKINTIVRMVVEGEDPVSMTKSVGLGTLEMTTILDNLKPDIVLIVGDRFEIFSVAISSALMNIPLAHIQGGEVTGTIDESIRHATTKLAHIHFPSTDQSKKRIIKMGENPKRVFNVGCPAVDHINSINIGKKEDILKIPHLDKLDISKPYAIIAQHPVTTEYGDSFMQMTNTLEAVQEIGLQSILLYPNLDAGSVDMITSLNRFKEKYGEKNVIKKQFKNLPFDNYLKLLAHSSMIIGNSSSGIREAYIFNTPAINIGTRQQDRERGNNVINVPHNKESIKNAIKNIMNNPKIKYNEKIYGNGNAGKQIANILSKIELNGIIQKKINY